jgi:hypothetical protein
MLATQKQAIESYQRVQDFLRDHPPPESPPYLAQKKALDEVVASLSDHSLNQVAGKRLRRAEGPRQRTLRRVLREQHLAPIAQIARATLADAPGIDKALRMPRSNLSALKLVAEASAMRSAAAQYEPQFVEAGCPEDFLAQLDAAAEAVRQSMLGKARNLGRQVGASAGIERDIKRGRRVIDVLDTIVKSAFREDQNVLAKWRNAKRVRATTGGGSAGSDAAPQLAAVAPVALVAT